MWFYCCGYCSFVLIPSAAGLSDLQLLQWDRLQSALHALHYYQVFVCANSKLFRQNQHTKNADKVSQKYFYFVFKTFSYLLELIDF